jgi:nucleoid-associated protein YgaU
MKKIFLVYILIYAILMSVACKSKAPPRTVELPTNVQSGSPSTPTVTQPESPTVPVVSQPPRGVENNIGSSNQNGFISGNQSGIISDNQSGIINGNQSGFISGNQSGIILDGAVSYTVKKGDTLSGIARQFYQDGSYYPLIMMVSDGISDIDKIYPNMKFIIPNLSANLNNPTAKESINRYFLQIANLEDQRGRTKTAALIRNHAR